MMFELNAICPVCGEEIFLDFEPEVGEIIYCPQCGSSCEVIRKDPLTLRELAGEAFEEYPEEEDFEEDIEDEEYL
jgi:lysine biosynthesis protein LysW